MWPRTYEGDPYWGGAVYTAFHGARLASVPSRDWSANPAGVPGRSRSRRASFSVLSSWRRSGAEKLVTSLEVSTAVRSVVPCRCATSGLRSSRSYYIRGQSRETDSLSRLLGSVKTTAKCSSLGSVKGYYKIINDVQYGYMTTKSYLGFSQTIIPD